MSKRPSNIFTVPFKQVSHVFLLPVLLKMNIWDLVQKHSEAVFGRCSAEKVLSKISQNPQENTSARVSFSCNFIKKETLVLVFSC